jgi:hypothetical protein
MYPHSTSNAANRLAPMRSPPKARTAAPLAMPTAGKLALTIAALRGITAEDVDRLNDPLWSYLQRFSTIYVDAARVRFLAGRYTSGLALEEAVEEIIAHLEEEAFGIHL